MEQTIAGLDASMCHMVCCDLGDLASIREHMAEAFAWQGGIDCVAYCAGQGGRARLRDTDPEVMRQRMNVNCFAFVEIMRALAKLKSRASPLRAVAISSLAALGHHRYLTAYAASKAALEAAARTISVELSRRNVRVNLVRPAYVDTPMIEDPLGNVAEMIREEYQPLGIISPDEVANMVLYLLGPASEKVNGAVFELNAGAFD